jgi:2-oxoisovalerate dehydrogenase E1 component
MSNLLTHKHIKEALLIRCVEEKFLELFSQGRLNGTVHTSVGQEFSAVAFAGQLKKTDFVFSNHRCHGHYISFTGDVEGLIAELMGKQSGTCGGVGSSQHLCNHNFFSNGIQGGIVPVAAGYALANKLRKNNNIGIVFIGDGTLGEGALYESMNIISKWQIPLMIVCENNSYAQSIWNFNITRGYMGRQ